MIFKDTTATKKIFSLRKRIRAVKGGTSASKTISILVWLIDYAQTHHNELISVVSQSFPHLSGGAMLDFENIMRGHNYWNDDRWVKNPKAVYTFETNTKIEFISIDTYGKAHGPRRDILFINEANNLDWKIADQLITRTRKIVWLDWNPSVEYWFDTELMPNRTEDIDYITLTYLDNEALDEVTVKEIEAHRYNKSWWQVYGLGQLGEIEGKIYKGWQQIDEIPHGAKLVRRWLDFGYSEDPLSLGNIYSYDGGYILDELAYQKGLANSQVSALIKQDDEIQTVKVITIADCAEPKSIDEIKMHGVTIIPSVKGKDSINYGIKVVQNHKIWVTRRSINTWKEYMNYVWETDKDGTILDVPIGIWNHSMDGIRYGITSLEMPQQTSVKIHRPTYKGFNRV